MLFPLPEKKTTEEVEYTLFGFLVTLQVFPSGPWSSDTRPAVVLVLKKARLSPPGCTFRWGHMEEAYSQLTEQLKVKGLDEEQIKQFKDRVERELEALKTVPKAFWKGTGF